MLPGGVDRELQETATVEKCRGSHSGTEGEVNSLSLSTTGCVCVFVCVEMRGQPSGEECDRLTGMNGMGGNHCMLDAFKFFLFTSHVIVID